MPDWSYQTLFRPLLFRLPSRSARSITLHAIRRVSRLPGGALIIKTLGHMEPSPLLEGQIAGIDVPTPIGLSGAVDPTGLAHQAISSFGIGFIEIGPITVEPIVNKQPIRNYRQQETIVYPSEYENEGLIRMLPLLDNPSHSLPQFVRVAPLPGAPLQQALDELRLLLDTISLTSAAGFYIDLWSFARSEQENLALIEQFALWYNHYKSVHAKPLFLYIPLDLQEDLLENLIDKLKTDQWNGFVIGDAVHTETNKIEVGKSGKLHAQCKVQLLRGRVSADMVIKVVGSVHEPQDAIDLLHAGANHVILHSGMIYAGPGLPKRVNEAIIYEKIADKPLPVPPCFWKHWGWICLLGVGMIVGGVLAWMVAASSVVLPYEEDFLEMTRSELLKLNSHLLHFMSHDRITLAGTMLSIGILYYQLAKNGLRYGIHWTRTAVLVSGIVGFPSFFLYLGYGFFDPFHAAAAIILFPLFILGMRANPDQPYRQPVNLLNDRNWRLAMWGQLCFIILGISLCIGGIVIAGVGVTHVFVPQDLAFLGVTPEQLEQANSRLLPLIAHDRAGFGGALFSDAVMLLIIGLWGIQQGQRWLWWTLLAGGSPAFLAGLSVHFDIHYVDFVHLLPAYFAFAIYIAGLILLYPYLMTHKEEPQSGARSVI